MTNDSVFLAGYVAKTIGLKGELGVKLQPGTPFPAKEILVETAEGKMPYTVKRVSERSQGITLLKLEGVDTIERAEELVGRQLYLSLESLPAKKGKDFYSREVTGFSVIDKKLGKLGILDEVLEYPHQRIFLVRNGIREILVPAVPEFIEKIDRAGRSLFVNTPEGLVDIYLGSGAKEEEE